MRASQLHDSVTILLARARIRTEWCPAGVSSREYSQTRMRVSGRAGATTITASSSDGGNVGSAPTAVGAGGQLRSTCSASTTVIVPSRRTTVTTAG